MKACIHSEREERFPYCTHCRLFGTFLELGIGFYNRHPPSRRRQGYRIVFKVDPPIFLHCSCAAEMKIPRSAPENSSCHSVYTFPSKTGAPEKRSTTGAKYVR